MRSWRLPVLVAGGALAVALLATLARHSSRSAGTATAAPVRHVLLITVDTLRADALGFAGNTEVSTPTLDRLAAGGRLFSDAHAHCVTTLPSHASILTGLYPHQHGVRKNGSFVLPGDVPTLASMLQREGFSTAAFVGAFPLDARFGLARGFDVYDDELDGGSAGDPLLLYAERSGREVVRRARAWWHDHRRERRFLWLHLFEPHAPYSPPEPFASQFAGSSYLGEVTAVDSHLSPLLAPFLAGDEAASLIVFTSDHGESLGDHGELTHGLFAYEATLKVPLVLWGAGVGSGIDSRPARHIDLLPTVLAATGVDPPATLPGRSLLGPAESHPDSTYFEALSTYLDFGWAPLRGVIKDGKKLIDLPIPELYDLRTDPGETRNISSQEKQSSRRLARLLPKEADWPPEARDISAAEAERLRSLGYLGGSARNKARYTPADDPKNLVALDRKVARMNDLSLAGELRQAIELGREILAERPSMSVVYLYLATFQIRSGDLDGAIETLELAQRRGAADREHLRQLGLTLASAGRALEAVSILEPLASDPRDIESQNHLALALAHLGRHQEALAILGQATEHDPGFARTFENLSYVNLLLERWDEARRWARQAIDLDPSLASSWNNLGVSLYRLGRPAEAIEAWRLGVSLARGDLEILFNLGAAQAQTGDFEGARATLSNFLAAAPTPLYQDKRRQAQELLARLE